MFSPEIENEVKRRRTRIHFNLGDFVPEIYWQTGLAAMRGMLLRIHSLWYYSWDKGKRKPDLNADETMWTYVNGNNGDTGLRLSYNNCTAFAKHMRELQRIVNGLVNLADFLEEQAGKRFGTMLDQEAKLAEDVKKLSRRSSSG